MVSNLYFKFSIGSGILSGNCSGNDQLTSLCNKFLSTILKYPLKCIDTINSIISFATYMIIYLQYNNVIKDTVSLIYYPLITIFKKEYVYSKGI